MYQVGIDIGSTAAKAVVISDGTIIKTILMSTGFSSRQTADEIYKILESEGINKDNSVYVATGYGRVSVPYADRAVTEITCHGKGAWYLFGKNGTVIDIGGQDVKGISIDTDGTVKNFAMNDKCAAGTGRFYEAMANAFEMTFLNSQNFHLMLKILFQLLHNVQFLLKVKLFHLLVKANQWMKSQQVFSWQLQNAALLWLKKQVQLTALLSQVVVLRMMVLKKLLKKFLKSTLLS